MDSLPGQPSLAELEKRIDQLPLLPTVVARLMALNQNEDNFFEQVAQLAAEDPPFAAKIMQTANSPASAPVSPISSIEDAVTRLGARAISGLVTSMAVLRVFVPTAAAQKKLWVHSLEVAVGARQIAQALPELRPLADRAYLLGLLHDIGRFIMFEMTPDILKLVDETHWQDPNQLMSAERQIYQFNHSELGYLACKKWDLPEQVALVTRNHHLHFELKQSGLDQQTEQLVRVVIVADFLSVCLLHHPEYETLDSKAKSELIATNCFPSKWSHALVSQAVLEDSADEIWSSAQAMAKNLGVL